MSTLTKVRKLAMRARRGAERAVYGLGDRVECTLCAWTGWRFLPAGLRGASDRSCPRCGSLERYRMLPLILRRELAGRDSIRLLEIAPKPAFTRFCRAQSSWKYVSSDLDSPRAMLRGDLRAMPIRSDAFDVIVCFHVMEHISDDLAAYREIARMLAPTGFALICVPLQGSTTQEGAPRSEWERLYGQDDHVRYYGMDVVQRMENAGLSVRALDAHEYFDAAQRARFRLDGDDRYVFLARRA